MIRDFLGCRDCPDYRDGWGKCPQATERLKQRLLGVAHADRADVCREVGRELREKARRELGRA